MFQPALGHQLHADADAEERTPGIATERSIAVAHAGHSGQPGGAVGERPLPRQHHPIGGGNRRPGRR